MDDLEIFYQYVDEQEEVEETPLTEEDFAIALKRLANRFIQYMLAEYSRRYPDFKWDGRYEPRPGNPSQVGFRFWTYCMERGHRAELVSRPGFALEGRNLQKLWSDMMASVSMLLGAYDLLHNLSPD